MIRPIHPADQETLVRLFCDNLRAQPDYISHVEMQMGLSADGTTLAPDAEAKWRRYLERHLADADSRVRVAERDGVIAGMVIFGVEADHDAPYGVIYDLLVAPGARGGGVGAALLEYAIEALAAQGIADIYLESGVGNHTAHAFFERRGFGHVSNIYRLKIRP